MFVIFVAYQHTEAAARFVQAIAGVPDVRPGLITQDAQEAWPAAVRDAIAGHWRVNDALNGRQIVDAARELAARHGSINRMLGAMEQVQLPLAEARAVLGVPGMNVETAKNFRDKARMKHLFRAHGVPCARSEGLSTRDAAWAFAKATGYPVILKPLDGAASQATFKCEDAPQLQAALDAAQPAPHKPAIIEEFIVGEEGSLDTFTVNGVPVWHSITHYHPTPLDCMRNPWIQWRVVLPREVDDARYDYIRAAGSRALAALGMDSGLSHLEWFRRAEGSLAISEVAARPAGAQITTLMSRSCDCDMVQAWAGLATHGKFDLPERKFAAGAAYLRGMDGNRVRHVRGWDAVQRELGGMITDVRLPVPGQSKSLSYEGEGYAIVRHAETREVERALQFIIDNVRVEME